MDWMKKVVEDLIIDKRCIWDSTDHRQVEQAKKWFVAFKRQGVPIQDKSGKTVQFFRPHYEELVAKASVEHAGNRTMKILCEKGDERVVWDANNGHQAKQAKDRFIELLKKGYSAYSVDTKGKKSRRIEEFDVEAEEILMIPPTAKG